MSARYVAGFPAEGLPRSLETLYTFVAGVEGVETGASPTAASHRFFKTELTTGGTEGAETYNLADGTGQMQGRQRLLELVTLAEAGDSVALDHANISQGDDTITGVALDAEDEFILLELRGDKWEVLFASSGVVSTN